MRVTKQTGSNSKKPVENLGQLEVKQRTGKEPFHNGGQPLNFDLLGFWRWSSSDIVNNRTRGILAEYLVAQAIGVADESVREEWAPYDLKTKDGLRIEVKSAAYIQSWRQSSLSKIGFNVSKTHALNEDTNKYSTETKRQADLYVFAILAHQDQNTLDPFDLEQWEFYVLPTYDLDNRKRSQHSIMLSSLQKLAGEPVSFFELKEAIEKAANEQKENSS